MGGVRQILAGATGIAAFLTLFHVLEVQAREPTGPLDLSQEWKDLDDRKMLQCLSSGRQDRLKAISALALVEERIEERLEALVSRLSDPPELDPAEFSRLLHQIDDQANQELWAIRGSYSSDPVLKGYLATEVSRILGETALRMAMASSPNPGLAREFLAKAKGRLEFARSELLEIDPKLRSRQIPALMGRMLRSELSLAHFELMARPDAPSTSVAVERMSAVAEGYRKMAASPEERLRVGMLATEAMLSYEKTEAGASASGFTLAPNALRTFQKWRSELAREAATAQKGELADRARTISTVASFYGEGRAGREPALERLKKLATSSDPSERAAAEASMQILMERNAGTVLGRQLLHESKQLPFREGHGDFIRQFEADELARQKSYDGEIQAAVGVENAKKLGLASYDDLMKSNGDMASLQREYMESLASLSALQKSSPGEELHSALGRADIHWAYLQCHRIAVGVEGIPTGKITAPFGSFTPDFSACASPGGSLQASRIVSSAVISKRNQELAWLAGEFAFDVATVLASGGAALLIKAPLKAGIKKAGTSLLRKQATSAVARTAIKAGVRSTALAATTVAIDLSNQTLTAGKSFLAAGLRGSWDTRNFMENFGYAKPGATPEGHLTRLMTTAIASRGLDILWGRVPALAAAPKGIELTRQQQIGEVLKGMATGSLTKVGADTVGGVSESLVCKRPGNSPLDTLLQGNTWVNAAKDAMLSRFRGTRMMAGRFMATTIAERSLDFKGDTEDKIQLRLLQECVAE